MSETLHLIFLSKLFPGTAQEVFSYPVLEPMPDGRVWGDNNTFSQFSRGSQLSSIVKFIDEIDEDVFSAATGAASGRE